MKSLLITFAFFKIDNTFEVDLLGLEVEVEGLSIYKKNVS